MPRFVILEHRWNGVHWDLMLEDEATGLLRTWAVDAPIGFEADLPARALADHRAAYLDYEGPVSGDRGTVSRWASGTYRAEVWTADRVRARLEGDQLVGVVELRRLDEGEGGGTRRLAWVLRLGKAD